MAEEVKIPLTGNQFTFSIDGSDIEITSFNLPEQSLESQTFQVGSSPIPVTGGNKLNPGGDVSVTVGVYPDEEDKLASIFEKAKTENTKLEGTIVLLKSDGNPAMTYTLVGMIPKNNPSVNGEAGSGGFLTKSYSFAVDDVMVS
ncbi:MAG: hypothetical protein MI784_03490 [Cytophagales bacterium]|nr:hypothetical protein [Cytophagales bacterium]